MTITDAAKTAAMVLLPFAALTPTVLLVVGR